MNIGFIGAGKAGTALGRYLADHGQSIVGYASKTQASAEHAASCSYSRLFSSAVELASASDLLIISTPDSAIAEVWHELCDACDAGSLSLQGKIIAHLSGATSSAVFANASYYGALVCSAHPLLAFGDEAQAPKQLESAHFSVEGDAFAVEQVSELLQSAGNSVHAMRPEDKMRYHAAAVFSSNLVLAPLNMAVEILSTCGFTKEEAREALTPLIKGNVDNFCKLGAVDALTGPVDRGDKSTVKAHIESFQVNGQDASQSQLYAEALELYTELTRALLPIAQAAHPERSYGDWNDVL